MTKKYITKLEARALIFWASIGFTNSVGGLNQNIPVIAADIARRFGISFGKKDFMKSNKKYLLWITPKSANELWKASVHQSAHVPFVVTRELFRIKKKLPSQPSQEDY